MQDLNSHLGLFFEPIRAYLEDDKVSEIMINGPDRIFIERGGKLEQSDQKLSVNPPLKPRL